ncbi:MAG: DUF1801 domain-containing protein [Candidatus Buchananbacteria bacterium]|nr:DUF1801 domain-containing protein [Candidatus Buchananbacteria bacterium]
MKGKPTKTIDAYIKTFPKNVQATLKKLKSEIKLIAPKAEETINYGIPTFKLNGNLVHFAAYKTHIGFYPGSFAIKKFAADLAKYEVAKGTVRFPLDKPLPLSLIKKIVRFRVSQNTKKHNS